VICAGLLASIAGRHNSAGYFMDQARLPWTVRTEQGGVVNAHAAGN
jgi:hypothetical protein